MDCKTLDGASFRLLLKSGYSALSAHYQEINDLNVFPVPDGDTGTNMKMTFESGLNSVEESDRIDEVAASFAKGMLFGARGNSGVLSSRYFNGLSEGLKGHSSVSVQEFALAMVSAYQIAYQAVDDPAEGTILTVAREGIENVRANIDYSKITYASFFAMVVDAMKVSLDHTPELLPILKESGVVDSGGKGLLTIFQGFLGYFTGESLEEGFREETDSSSSSLPKYDFSLFNENSVLEYGYCTEFLLQLQNSKIDIPSFDLEKFISFLHGHGNSIVCFQNGSIVKVHIHTKKPYEVIEFAQRYGEFLTFKMENMALQHNNVVEKKNKKAQTKKKFAIVSIAQGEGLIRMFKDLGSDIVLDGGKTMNTSSSELIDAFEEANADTIIVLPDNANILMAAHQAANLYKNSKIYVLETKSIPAGYACLSMLVGDEQTAEDCYESMKEENEWVVSGFICRSIRNTTADGVKCVEGNYIEGVNGKLVGCDAAIGDALKDLLSHVENISEKETLFFFYGNSVTEEEARKTKAEIEKLYPQLEVAAFKGDQAVYDYLFGIN
jgi:DAK2 domain fusion protein YloV